MALDRDLLAQVIDGYEHGEEEPPDHEQALVVREAIDLLLEVATTNVDLVLPDGAPRHLLIYEGMACGFQQGMALGRAYERGAVAR